MAELDIVVRNGEIVTAAGSVGRAAVELRDVIRDCGLSPVICLSFLDRKVRLEVQPAR
jgi:hypothetical protein